MSRCLVCQVLWAVDGLFVGYKGIEGGFEELWSIVLGGSAEELGGLLCLWQGCVGSLCPSTKCLFPLPNPLISPVATQQ